jgi:hypothetical protein
VSRMLTSLSIIQGFYLLLAVQTIRRQVLRARRSRQNSHRIILVYSIAMLVLVCIWFFTGAVTEERVNVEIPLNPDLKVALATCDPVTTVRVLSRTIMIWLSDGIMVGESPFDYRNSASTKVQVWRTYVIWNGQKAIAVISILVYLATIGECIQFFPTCIR